MPVYEYKGFDAAGKSVNGIVDADNGKVARLAGPSPNKISTNGL